MNRAPLIFAIVLLLLPVLYVGSYLALVTPDLRAVEDTSAAPKNRWRIVFTHYRFGRPWSERIYWPLEQIDRKVRPKVWELPSLDDFVPRNGGARRRPISRPAP